MAAKHSAKSFYTEQEQYSIVNAIKSWENASSQVIAYENFHIY